MKILNLYSGIGGNRKLWTPNGDDHEITAVEYKQEIADIYKYFFPNDTVIVADAHQYLLDHYKEFDFIWSSTPCPYNSRARFWGYHKTRPVYPDLTLYQQRIFLDYHHNGLHVNENVIPYYDKDIKSEMLMKPSAKIGRHFFWSNFKIGTFEHKSSAVIKLSGTSEKDKRERNKTDPEIGLYILNCARNIITKSNVNQLDIFNQNGDKLFNK